MNENRCVIERGRNHIKPALQQTQLFRLALGTRAITNEHLSLLLQEKNQKKRQNQLD